MDIESGQTAILTFTAGGDVSAAVRAGQQALFGILKFCASETTTPTTMNPVGSAIYLAQLSTTGKHAIWRGQLTRWLADQSDRRRLTQSGSS